MPLPPIHKVKSYVVKKKHHISAIAVVVGFVVDNLTLTRIDLLIDNLLIVFYIVISFVCIAILHRNRNVVLKILGTSINANVIVFIMQFALGGLMSSFIVFYMRSSSLSSSWPFMILLLGLMIGNEVFEKYYDKFTFSMSIHFIALYSYLIFLVPIIVKDISPIIFVISGLVTLIIEALLISILALINKQLIFSSQSHLRRSILIIFLLFNCFYFLNIIPPVPLSGKTIGVYHNLQKTSNNYQLTFEPSICYFFFQCESTIVHRATKTDPVYVFSSIYAPTDLRTNIYHSWFYKNPLTNKWEDKERIPIPIIGGRIDGYRSFSRKSTLPDGNWRVQIETKEGQVIDSIEFEILNNQPTPQLSTKTI